jgi:long-chain acyl-CoA synthetase
LHGYGGQATQWRYQLHEFSVSNRVIAVDQRGHGHSDAPENGYSMPQLVRDLEESLKELNVEFPILLVGHSFGGAVAAEFTALHPEQVSDLILIATAGEFRLNWVYRALLQLPRAAFRPLTPFLRGWLSAPPRVMHAWYYQNLKSWNGWSLFRSLQTAVTVIRGHYDRVFSKPHFDEVARAIPHAEEVNVGASGHLVMLERREAVNRAIQRTLERRVRSWRDGSGGDTEAVRDALLRERPWLAYYDEGVPYTIAIPRVPAGDLLYSAASRFPSRTAIIFEGRRLSYRQLASEASRFARALQSLGLREGDRVMLLLPNIPQMAIAYFGVLAAGAVAVFSPPGTDPEHYLSQISQTGAKFLVTLRGSEAIVASIIDRRGSSQASPIDHLILTGALDYLPWIKRNLAGSRRVETLVQQRRSTAFPVVHDFTQLIRMHPAATAEVRVSPDSKAAIQFTGGTTAQPKGVTLSHRNLVANALQTRHWMPAAREGKEIFLCLIPFSHSYGLTTALNVPVALGATLILKAKFEVRDLLESIRKYRPTIFPGVPNMYVAIKDYPGVRKFGISSIRACISGSAPLPIEVQEAFEKLTRGRLVEGYGLTEAGPVTHANPLYGQRKIGTIGIPLPSTEARLVDMARGVREVEAGQIGELAVRGPQVMLGYWEDPKGTRRAFTKDGFLLTGDVAQRDSQGYFRIIARKADMWYPHKPGEPAFPRDIEEVLFEIPQVREAAVVAIANQPVAFIIAQRDRPRVEDVLAYCRRRLPPELVPRLVIFLDEFPRTFIGKILRRELALLFETSQKEHQRVPVENHP